VGDPRALLCFIERTVKLGDVQRKGSIGAPLDGLRLGLQIEVGVGQMPAHPVVELAQLATRLGVRRVGPKEKSDLLSRLGCVSVEQEISQQQLF
jgi:hypothetical protein